MKISVIGAGYVGLTTAACLSQIGHDVFCSESDAEKLHMLQAGVMPLFEPHLEEIIAESRKSGRLTFGSTEDAIDWGQAIFICVGTPPLANGDADFSAIESVARMIAKRAVGYRLIVEKSTVPVQTGAQLRKHLAVHRTQKLDYDVASNPEFLREGTSVEDFLHPDRIVVGVDSARAADRMQEIYQPVIDQKIMCPIHAVCPSRKPPRFLVTDTNSSELIKHASNSFLATKISFINMVSDLCEAVGADISKVAEGIGLDPRIGSSFLQPGIGFGGFCFPKDLQAFVRIAEKFGCDFALLKEVERINQNRVEHSGGEDQERALGFARQEKSAYGVWLSSRIPMTFASRPRFPSFGVCWPRARTFRPTIPKRWTKPGRKFRRCRIARMCTRQPMARMRLCF